MNPASPKTLPAWESYIQTLTGADLLSKARAANSVDFARALEADGLTPAEVRAVFVAFVRRLEADGQEVPARSSGDFFDYGALLHPDNLT